MSEETSPYVYRAKDQAYSSNSEGVLQNIFKKCLPMWEVELETNVKP